MITTTPELFLASVPERLRSILCCPSCGQQLAPDIATSFHACGGERLFADDVLVAMHLKKRSYFDDVFKVMQAGNHAEGTWDIFYKDQIALVESSLKAGEIVVDVGCGPELPYKKNGAIVIGADASFESIRANQGVDLRIFASADRLPLVDGSIDAVVCFYSVHHMTGATVAENRSIVSRVFHEFARILKPSGRVMIFDVSPRWPFASLENAFWDIGRQRLGGALDMFFWKDLVLREMAHQAMPSASFSQRSFAASALKTFPPIFSKPQLRLPRVLYPFDINLYVWQLPSP